MCGVPPKNSIGAAVQTFFDADIVVAGRFGQERRTGGLLAIGSISGFFNPLSYEPCEQMSLSQSSMRTHRANSLTSAVDAEGYQASSTSLR
jgi:hypothetical protein